MQTWSDVYYNPFVLPDLQRAGYLGSLVGDHGRDAVLDMRDRQATYGAARVGIRSGAVCIPSGMAFDSGGLGKGYALDQLAERIEQAGIENYWVSLGGDIIGRGVDPDGEPWRITLDDIAGAPVVTFDRSTRTAVATSSVRKRAGASWHHLIDPRTGQPSTSSIDVVSVVADSGVHADVLAKSLLLAGDSAQSLWRHHTEAQTAYLETANGYLRHLNHV